MKKFFTLILAFVAISAFAETTPKGTLETDKAALLEIYTALNGASWSKTVDGTEVTFNWNAETDIVDFIGVTIGTINGIDRVTELDLSNVNNLEGEIPAAIGKLDGLKSINLDGNLYLSGSIPDEFYDMMSLESIHMANTSLSGTISNKIGRLTNLKTIFMEKNSFMTGGLPDSIGLCTKLDYVRIADCPRMTGTISSQIGNCTALTVFQCERSNFSGPIPEGIATLPNLKYLNMNYNNFTTAPNFAATGARFPSVMAELHQNLIPFGYLLPLKNYTRSLTETGNTWYYRFIDQKAGLILTKDTIKVKIGDPLVLTLDELLPNNGGISFRWFFNDNNISSDKNVNLTMSNATAGSYYCEITTDQDIRSSGVCPLCGWQDAENTINPRPAYMATNTTAKLIVQVDNGSA
ncbi:MAG: hypothetical protein Q8914_08500, partial [Bacteroidota bacterium]|nr:hypothetical protein [Bacteroidota bacterium]